MTDAKRTAEIESNAVDLEAARNGHFVYTSFAAANVPETLARLMQLGIQPCRSSRGYRRHIRRTKAERR